MLFFYRGGDPIRRLARREKIKKWFGEIFRAHSKEEYKEFFTRGMNGDSGENRVYPWMYSRVFAVCFILFAVTAFVMMLTRNAISFPAMCLLGGVLIDLPFLTLIFECMPKRDISFFKLVIIAVIGGTVSIVMVELLYLYQPENAWLQLTQVAVVEELCKVIPSLVLIVVMKKRDNPLTSFAIAAAVGAGLTISENMGYILFNSFDEYLDIPSAISISVIRSITAVASHTVWAGYVGWAFAKFRRPFRDIRFYAVCLMCIAMHFTWDLTLATGDESAYVVLAGFLILFDFIFCIWFTQHIVKKERWAVLGKPNYLPFPEQTYVPYPNPYPAPNSAAPQQPALGDVFDEFSPTDPAAPTVPENGTQEVTASPESGTKVEQTNENTEGYGTYGNAAPSGVYGAAATETVFETASERRIKYSHIANVWATVAALLLSAFALVWCCTPIGWDNETKSFTDADAFKQYVQDNHMCSYLWDREFNNKELPFNYYGYKIENGEYVEITQRDFMYYYTYYFREGDFDGELERIQLNVDGAFYDCERLFDEEGYAVDDFYFYRINEKVIDCYYDSVYEEYVVILDNEIFYGMGTLVSLSVFSCIAFAVGATLFTVYKVKAAKAKKEIKDAE